MKRLNILFCMLFFAYLTMIAEHSLSKDGMECPTGQLLYGISADGQLLCRDISTSGAKGALTCKDVSIAEKTITLDKKGQQYQEWCEKSETFSCPDGWLVISIVKSHSCSCASNSNCYFEEGGLQTISTWDGAGAKSYSYGCKTGNMYSQSCPQVKMSAAVVRCCGLE